MDVFQGFRRFVSEDTIEVVPVDDTNKLNYNRNGDNDEKEKGNKATTAATAAAASPPIVQLKFKKLVICTGDRVTIPSNFPGLSTVPYTTNGKIFNLTNLSKRMIVLGSGVVALEMEQTFSTFGSDVLVLLSAEKLFPKK